MKKSRKMLLSFICLTIMCTFVACGVNHRSPEGVVKDLVKYSVEGKSKKILACYGLDETNADKSTLAEVESVIQYFQAMKSQGITLVSCDIIRDFDDYAFVYVSYQVDLPHKKAYPKIDTYLVNRKEDQYCVMATKDITAEMSEAVREAYAAFASGDVYRKYQESYDAFTLRNPSFEEELSMKLNQT